MKKSTRKIMIAFFVMIVVAALVLFGYYMLSSSGEEKGAEAELPATEVEKILAKDLELKYPETPSEVVKLYWRINKCMYNQTKGMSDEDFEALLKQLRMLYDEEFLSVEENSWDNMLMKFEADKTVFVEKKRMISSYVIQEDKDVTYNTIDGQECATLYADVIEVEGEENARSRGEFICRKDASGKWKILGWKQVANKEKKEK